MKQPQLASVSLVRQQMTSSFESFDLDESIDSVSRFELQLRAQRLSLHCAALLPKRQLPQAELLSSLAA